MKNANDNSREKYIHRTITYYTGKKVVADYVNRKFTEEEFLVYDETEIPVNNTGVLKVTKQIKMKLSDFIKYGEEEE